MPVGEARRPNARPGWFLLRFHWQAANGLGHPEFTYLTKPDETTAVDAGTEMLSKTFGESLALIEVHAQRPGEDFWRSVGRTQELGGTEGDSKGCAAEGVDER